MNKLGILLIILLFFSPSLAYAAPKSDPGKADPDVWWDKDGVTPKVVNGTNGTNGVDGKDGTDGVTTVVTKTVKEVVTITVTKDVHNGTDGANGLNAYELAVQRGYTGTLDEWLNSLKGTVTTTTITIEKDGIDGLSAYELDVQRGYKGTLGEWLDHLKGEKGDMGSISIISNRVSDDYLWLAAAAISMNVFTLTLFAGYWWRHR